MRKYNSNFKTAFLSEEGSKLKNNDFFGFVELDRYACYVIADGITDMRTSQSARKAIEAIIGAFQNAPGITKGRLKSYLKTANKELLKEKSYEKLKASVTVVVTDYEKLRYGHAGNTRLRLYRDGRKLLATSDMSLSQDMVNAEQLTEDKLARHEERNNLLSWLGKERFKPFISKKIRLADGDIITLFTKGIWENVDEGELSDIFAEAGNDPMEECDKVEDFLLSRQPADLDNYTFAAIYVDKVFVDPGRKKRRKLILTIVLVILLLALIAGVAVFLWRRDRARKREEMEQYFLNTETYINDNNFVRAKEECGKAIELAQKLRNKELEDRYNSYLVFLEAVMKADDCYSEGDYTEAKEAYLTAQGRARYADNAGADHIDRRLLQIAGYERVFDLILLGDSLLEQCSYELAEDKYMSAREEAAAIYFTEGRQQALDALDKLYEQWSAETEEQRQQNAALAADQVAAAEMVVQGNESYSDGDYAGAEVFYLIALEKYTALEDTAQVDSLNQKLDALHIKQAEVEAKINEAKVLEEQARLLEEAGDYGQAKTQYQRAKAIYAECGKSSLADGIQNRISIIDSKMEQDEE